MTPILLSLILACFIVWSMKEICDQDWFDRFGEDYDEYCHEQFKKRMAAKAACRARRAAEKAKEN